MTTENPTRHLDEAEEFRTRREPMPSGDRALLIATSILAWARSLPAAPDAGKEAPDFTRYGPGVVVAPVTPEWVAQHDAEMAAKGLAGKVTPPPAPETVCPTCGGSRLVFMPVGPRQPCPDCTGNRPSLASTPAQQAVRAGLDAIAELTGAHVIGASSEPSEACDHNWVREHHESYATCTRCDAKEFRGSLEPSDELPFGERAGDIISTDAWLNAKCGQWLGQPLTLAIAERIALAGLREARRDEAKRQERSRAAQQRAPDYKPDASECSTDGCILGVGHIGHCHDGHASQGKPVASEGDGDGARRAYEHAGKLINDADVPWPEWTKLGRSWRQFLIESYRFVRAESEAKLVAMEANAATVADQYERLEAKFRAVSAESEGRIRELEAEGERLKATLNELSCRLGDATVENLAPIAKAAERIRSLESELAATTEKLHASESRVKALEGQVAEMLNAAASSTLPETPASRPPR